MKKQIRPLVDEFKVGLQPPPDQTLSDWADTNRALSSESSAQKGQWVTWPWQREPMNCLSPSNTCEQVVLMCGSQLMKTELILNWLGYVIDCDPGPMLIVEHRESDVQSLSKDRITPMLRDTTCLRGKVADVRSRDSGNTTLHKTFTGGHVTLVGAISPSGLAMRPIRYLAMDEIDRYPVSAGTEGDPVSLASKRTVNFWNRKILLASTPTIHGMSRIDTAFEESDQRRYNIPCPHCGMMQVLAFGSLKWPKGKPLEAEYECSECGELIGEHHKAAMFEGGAWVAENPDSRIPGFHLSQLYSLIRTWGEIAEEFVKVKGHLEQLKVFTNTVLAETWRERGEAPDWEKLYLRQTDHFEILPDPVLFLTAGVDVQKDRLEISIYGWGRGKQSWLITHVVLPGDPYHADVWTQLDELLTTTFKHASGLDLAILRTAVDSGYAAQEVYGWARRYAPSKVMVVKGRDTGPALVGQPSAVDVVKSSKRTRRGMQVWNVNVSMAKAELYGWLGLATPEGDDPYPAGWCHFQGQDEEFYKQLVGEVWKVKIVKGFKQGEWVKIRERNEALDCRNYARAAASHLGMDRWVDQQWTALEAAVYKPADTIPDAQNVSPAPKNRVTKPQRIVIPSSIS